MRNRAFRLVSGALVVGSLAALAGFVMNAASGAKDQPFQKAAERIEPLHREKTPPGPSDWLASHDESGQTFEQYVRSGPNRPTAKRTTLYVQPIGAFSPIEREMVDQTAELLSRFYGLPAKVLDPLGLEVIPPEARRVHPAWGDRQILSTYVLDEVLKPRRPPDAVAVLGLAAVQPVLGGFSFYAKSRMSVLFGEREQQRTMFTGGGETTFVDVTDRDDQTVTIGEVGVGVMYTHENFFLTGGWEGQMWWNAGGEALRGTAQDIGLQGFNVGGGTVW